MKINAFHWSSHKTSYKIPVAEKFTGEITAAGVGEILLVGHTEDGPVILHSDLNRLYIRSMFEGFSHLELKAKEFGCRIKLDGIELGEALDNAPPPPRKEPTNILQKLRQKAREEMGFRREAFLANDTGRPGYEDEIELFEEDELELVNQTANNAPAKSANEPVPTKDDTGTPEGKDDN